MAESSLRQRVTALEAEVAALKSKIQGACQIKKDWLDVISGSSANDPIYEEAMRLGREWRESFRPKPRKRRKKA
jgi:hypothetical protein